MSDPNEIDGFKKNDCVLVKEDAWCCRGRKGRVKRVRDPSEGRPIIVAVALPDDSGPSGAIIGLESAELEKKTATRDWPIPKFP
ncbi:MAG TPA: hypothetical protein PLF81_06675 [Candidatus Anammoximicrobium sp.]|nr:hypothetical protein [Candidatus Anammoximicrobium sp.]